MVQRLLCFLCLIIASLPVSWNVAMEILYAIILLFIVICSYKTKSGDDICRLQSRPFSIHYYKNQLNYNTIFLLLLECKYYKTS